MSKWYQAHPVVAELAGMLALTVVFVLIWVLFGDLIRAIYMIADVIFQGIILVMFFVVVISVIVHVIKVAYGSFR